MVESVEKHQRNKQNMKETVSQKTKIDTFWVGPGMREVSFPSEPCIGTHSLIAKQFFLSNKMKIFLAPPFLLGKH